jgi:hypothetical protein
MQSEPSSGIGLPSYFRIWMELMDLQFTTSGVPLPLGSRVTATSVFVGAHLERDAGPANPGV